MKHKKFLTWVKTQTPRVVARKLGTESSTVHHWVMRTASPKAVTMQKLVSLGCGAFDYDDIINDTKPKSSRK